MAFDFMVCCFPGGARCKEPACQSRRHKRCRGDPWVGKIPWEGNDNLLIILARRIPWTEEPGGYSPWGCKESDTTEHRQTLSSYKYFEVIHSIFRLFMMPMLWPLMCGFTYSFPF